MGNAVSSSGLTTEEKAAIPVDVQEKATNLVDLTVNASHIVVEEGRSNLEQEQQAISQQRAVLTDGVTSTDNVAVQVVTKGIVAVNPDAMQETRSPPIDFANKFLIQDDAQVDYHQEEDSDDVQHIESDRSKLLRVSCTEAMKNDKN
ncbi:OLC1v1012955C1 [Oldenlandia corymbosa var. corymbosa]|uniref:OLC1v1012955C1 n=1 Tax=Oldenlandia corymbosa var. corymbosa TaxID=529605 RepID=A0AAV1E0R3_OLDCO|nr:OLC1v1012955C1 [Oldenlandia corymbosa var. corymbosa]